MKKNRKIFRWGVSLLLCLLAATLPAAIVYRCHTVSLSQCDELYRKYVDNPGIRASFIKDFPVNDTLAVDVLLLEATSDSAWCALLLDFGMPEGMVNNYKCNKDFYVGEGRSSIIRIFINKHNPKERVPVADTNGWLTIGSFEKKSLSVFITEGQNVKEIISKKEIRNLKNKKNENVF